MFLTENKTVFHNYFASSPEAWIIDFYAYKIFRILKHWIQRVPKQTSKASTAKNIHAKCSDNTYIVNQTREATNRAAQSILGEKTCLCFPMALLDTKNAE